MLNRNDHMWNMEHDDMEGGGGDVDTNRWGIMHG
jgi:hypothetical protein